MSSVSQGSSRVNQSACLGAPGPAILHLFGPPAFEGSGRDLLFLSPFGGGKDNLPSSAPLAYI